MVRRTRGALVAAAMVAGLAACGSGGAAEHGRTLTFWTFQPLTPQGGQILERLRTDFEKANGVTVKLVQIPKDDYNTKLGTAIASKNVPDGGYLDQPLVSRYALDGTILQVPAGTIDEKEFYAGGLETNKVGGRLYGVPLDITTVGLYYNKKLVPTPPRTWDELKQAAESVHRADPKTAGIVVPKGDGYGAWMWPGFVAGAGGTLVDEKAKKVTFDEQPAVDALQLWVDLLKSSPRSITDADKAFENGLAAMTISGPWDISTIRDQFPDLDFGVAPLPYKNEPASNIGGENAVVFTGTKNADLAWKWLKHLTAPDSSVALAEAVGGYPANIEGAGIAAAKMGPEHAVFIEALKATRARPAVPQWIQINDEIIAPALESALTGKVAPRQALSEAGAKARTLLGWNG
ncbi:ABC transporter substrate-binding protein [Planomonospora parontospora subsp. parontospora]|uniref:ABC transporter substrate-binding protein n=2 Tax=Planomonospora parontospora TaxID=58119 RepID=A0AA37BBD0_9ACTN|nr:ABC transporter substrate-binding protein [Planomonospora parontospora]GGK45441.1 ABC transporter substrate-binding protein [Planomonospora parontospora]GII06323.1 ABC transporter substrate-binding protein [Planomonospora parontospora subsp. parontospora]